MTVVVRLAAALAVVMLASSCSKDQAGGSKPAGRKSGQVLALSEGAGAKALEDRYGFQKGDIKRDENGNFVGGKRSQFDGKRHITHEGGIGTASYRKSAYQAPQWTGKTEARTWDYQGNTDGSRFQTQSRFQDTSARQSGQSSRFHGQAAATSTYQTDAAAANAARRLDKPSDAHTEYRRRVNPDPLIISKEDYDRLTIEQTRSILGRDR